MHDADPDGSISLFAGEGEDTDAKTNGQATMVTATERPKSASVRRITRLRRALGIGPVPEPEERLEIAPLSVADAAAALGWSEAALEASLGRGEIGVIETPAGGVLVAPEELRRVAERHAGLSEGREVASVGGQPLSVLGPPRAIGGEYVGEEKIAEVAYWLAAGEPVLMLGYPGCGKTTLFRTIAARCGWPERMASFEDEISRRHLVGQYLLGQQTYWVDGELTAALRAREPIFLDEITRARPETINALLELAGPTRTLSIPEHRREKIAWEEPFRLLLAGNPADQIGTRELGEAFRSRCQVVWLDYPSPEDELAVVAERYPDLAGGMSGTVEHVIQVAGEMRNLMRQHQIGFAFTTREVLAVCRLLNDGYDTVTAFYRAVATKLTLRSEWESLQAAMKQAWPLVHDHALMQDGAGPGHPLS